MALGTADLDRRCLHGAQLLTVTDRTLPLVRFTVALKVGALSDEKAHLGALSLLLPLMLRGTKNRSRHVFNAAVEALGSSIDAVVGHELAYLTGTCLEKHLEATFALVTEALMMPALLQEELEPLCDEAIQALLSERDDDDSVADLFLRRALYVGHPLFNSPAGTLITLKNMSLAAVGRAQQHFRPERLVVAMAGAIDGDTAQKLAEPLLVALQGPVVPMPPLPRLPTISVPKIIIVDKKDRTQVQLRVARQGLHASHRDIDAFWLGINAFGGTFTSPLTREVRDVRGWSYFAHADFRRRSLFASPVVLRSAPALGDAIDCLTLKREMFADLCRGELQQQSLDLAKNYLLGRVPFAQATAFDIIGPAVHLEILGLDPNQLWDLPHRLAAVDLAGVPEVMRRALSKTADVTVMVAPKKQVYDKVLATFDDVDVDVVPFDEGLSL